MQLVTPEQIAAVMALAPAPHSFAELDEQVAEGLPKAALKAGVERLGRNPDERRILLHRVVPEATALELPAEVLDNYLYDNAHKFFFNREQ